MLCHDLLKKECGVWEKACPKRFTGDIVCVKQIKKFNHNNKRCWLVHCFPQTEITNQQFAAHWRFKSQTHILYDSRNAKLSYVFVPKHWWCTSLFCNYNVSIQYVFLLCVIQFWTHTVLAGTKEEHGRTAGGHVQVVIQICIRWPLRSSSEIFLTSTGKITWSLSI